MPKSSQEKQQKKPSDPRTNLDWHPHWPSADSTHNRPVHQVRNESEMKKDFTSVYLAIASDVNTTYSPLFSHDQPQLMAGLKRKGRQCGLSKSDVIWDVGLNRLLLHLEKFHTGQPEHPV
ncbi:hypothetical protein CDAR_398151 [Caerostris darwini]|uniref:Uncharacterized protein n=1 Tax=Caerostris darwini TaxID=1538125 RepID=A0AAV4WR62_9ARAC|nr:hypothetical protein CDAR_398151 [Caerostris darwini]